MKINNTKKALVLSTLALLLCVSMLVGTTFAWFTDSVSSTNNIIKSGNLDVELYYQVEGQSDWSKLGTNTNVFMENALWEPGHTEVVKLKVVNEGTLALKYQLGVNIASETGSVNVNGREFELSDFIKYGIVEGAQTYTRDQAVAAVDATAQTLKTAYTKSSSLESKDEAIVTMVVYMPTTVDNEANYAKGEAVPTINLGINLLATQNTVETDSFDNQYDLAAPWIGKIPASLDDTTLEIVPGNGTQTGTITVNSAEDLVYLATLANEWVSLYSNGQGTNVGSYRENVGGKGTDYYYHWTWTINLAADLDMSNIPMDSIDISYWDNLEGNGHTISNVVLKDGQDGLFINGAKAINDLTVKNITVNAPAADTVGAVSGNGSMTNVHVENATVIGGKYVGGICGKGSSFVNCSIKNSTVTGNNKTVGGLVGYSIGDPNAAEVTGNLVENVTVIGTYNVGGLLGQSQNETVDNNTVKNVAVKSTLDLPEGASSNEVRTAQLAARSDFANTTIGTNNTVENVTMTNVVNVTTTAALQDAINSGATEIALGAGEFTADFYVVPANRNLTITGQGALTKLNFKNQQVRLELFDSLTISNCTMGRMVDKSWGQLVFGSSSVANGVYTISNCIFNGEGTQGIYINQNVAATFNIENCTFNGDFGGEGAITIQNNDGVDITVNVTDCSFNNIPETSHEIYMLYAYNGWTLNAPGVAAYWKTNP